MDLQTDAKPEHSKTQRKIPTEDTELKKPDLSSSNDQRLSTLCEKLTVDDFRSIKMLWGQFIMSGKSNTIQPVDIKTPAVLFRIIRQKVKTEVNLNILLLEILYIIQRFDLLKLFDLCKHSVSPYLKSSIDPTWKECYKVITQYNGSERDREALINNLVVLLQKEESNKQDNLIQSSGELLDVNILHDVQRKLAWLEDALYPMDNTPCGLCLIINNRKFTDKETYPEREGTETDRNALAEIFEEFGFIIRDHKDLTALEIRREIRNLSEENHSNHNCIVCCILTHGEEGVVLGIDGNKVNIDKDIVSVFSGKSTLMGKPKLFFIQACQGIEKMKAVVEPTEGLEPDSAVDELQMAIDALNSDSGMEVDDDGNILSHPARSDDLVCLSTVEGFSAYRSRTTGTWFITTLVRELKLFGTTEDIMDVMRRVNCKVAQAEGKIGSARVKQQPVQKTTLRKKLIFKRKI